MTDWTDQICKGKVKAPRNTPLEPVDINVVNAILKTYGSDFTGIRVKAKIHMLLDIGIRASELLALNYENVNPIPGVIQILHGKGDKFVTAYLSKKSRLAFRRYITNKEIKEGAFITSQENIRLMYSELRQILKRWCEKAGVEYHPLRLSEVCLRLLC